MHDLKNYSYYYIDLFPNNRGTVQWFDTAVRRVP
jgi:hypothetical protein